MQSKVTFTFRKIELKGLDRLMGAKILFKYGEARSIGCDCTHEEKTVFLGFTQNGCYGNQPHPFEALIQSTDSIDASSSCSSIKQDLIFKQAHLASFCFVLASEPKF